MNVLFVTLDEFRADCLSCAGHPVVATPHLDRLAVEGVRFASHFSQAAPCAPGRVGVRPLSLSPPSLTYYKFCILPFAFCL